MAIAYDIDEVLVGWVEPYLAFSNNRYNTHYTPEDIVVYEFWEIMGISREQAMSDIQEFWDSPYAQMIRPIEGASYCIDELRKLNEKEYIITARDISQRKMTIAQLNQVKEGFVNGNLEFTCHASTGGAITTKDQVCHMYGIDTIIDDATMHAEDCLRTGLNVIMPERPWNRSFNSYTEKDGLYRAKTMYDVPEILFEIRKNQ